MRDLSDILTGQRVMMPENCVRVTADCDGYQHPYYVRLPVTFAKELPINSSRVDGEIARVITHPISVKQMHKTAAALRAKGADLFFAGIEE